MLSRLAREIAPRMLGFKLARRGLVPPPRPINLTYSVTNKCNSRCRSCDIWKIYPAEKHRLSDELTVDEIERVFRTVGPVYFFNISGGEPFLRADLPKIIEVGCRHLRPAVVHIPTNALMPARIEALTIDILEGMKDWAPNASLTLKPSMDGVGHAHDWVRGVAGNYDKLIDTVGRLRRLKARYPKLKVGVGTVVSTMNIHTLPDIIEAAQNLGVDTYISEIAEERAEMRNVDSDITPPHETYRRAINPFKRDTLRRLEAASGMALLTQAMRYHYYDLTATWLQTRAQPLPCFAALSNVQLSPYGEVWPCAVLGDGRSLGNVRDAGYDFQTVWQGERAKAVRESIARGECDCPLANQSYANMLLDPMTMASVAATIAQSKARGLLRRFGVVGDMGEDVRVEPVARQEQTEHPFDAEQRHGGRKPPGPRPKATPRTSPTAMPRWGSDGVR